MNLQYKLLGNNFRKPQMLPWAMLTDRSQLKNSKNYSENIPEEILFQIKSNLFDFCAAYENAKITSQCHHMKQILEIIKCHNGPLLFIECIVELNIIQMCIDILRRAPFPDITLYTAQMIYYLSRGSSDYLPLIATADFRSAVEYNLQMDRDNLNYLLILISNQILQNPVLSPLFNGFDLGIICKILKTLTPARNVNEFLQSYSYAIFIFMDLFSKSTQLDCENWCKCFDSLKFAYDLNLPQVNLLISSILQNMIISSNFNNKMFLETPLPQFVIDHFIDHRKHLVLFYTFYFFHYGKEGQSMIIDTDKILSIVSLPDFDMVDAINLCYMLHNFILIDHSFCCNPLIQSFLRFVYERYSDSGFIYKKVSTYFFCSFAKIAPSAFFSQITPEEFVCILNDAVEDYDDIEEIQCSIDAIVETYAFISKENPLDIPKLLNSEIIEKIHNIILKNNESLRFQQFFEIFSPKQ